MATVSETPKKRRQRNARGVYVISRHRIGGAFPYDTFRLIGVTRTGKRVRKQSLSREELVGLKQEYQVRDANAPDDRAVTSHLSPAQIRQAEAAFLRLAEHARKMKRSAPYELDLAVQHFLDTYYEPSTDKTLAQLMPEFLTDLATVRHRSKSYLISMQNDLERLCAFPGTPPRFSERKRFIELPLIEHAYGRLKPHEFLTQPHAYTFMQALRVTPAGAAGEPEPVGNKRWNNVRGNFHSFFEWMLMPPRRYIARNPFSDVETRTVKKKTPGRLSARQALDLMADVITYNGGRMVPYFALLLFGGIRPAERNGEIDRLARHPRLHQLVNLNLGIIDIDETIAKGEFVRKVVIQPALRAWLQAYPLREFPIFPTNARAMIDIIRKRHKLGHDVLRHSFISFHTGKFRSAGDAALNAGNSESVTRKRYLNPPTEREADLFWRITPELLRAPEALAAFNAELASLEAAARG